MQTENKFKKTSNTFFDKKDFLKMGGAVLITLLVVYLYNISQIVAPLTPPNPAHLISTTEMYDFYNQYTDAERISILYDSNGVSKPGKLQGFPIATTDLEEIIHRNKIKNNLGLSIKPDKILFYLGQDGAFNNNGQKIGNIKMIAVGLFGTTLLIPTNQADMNDKLKSSIYDKAMPCPGPGCPTKPPQPPPTSLPPPISN